MDSNGASTAQLLTEEHTKLLYLISVYTSPKSSGKDSKDEKLTKGRWIRKIPLLVLIYEGMFDLAQLNLC